MGGTLYTLDWVVIGAYFLLLFGIAFWVIRRKTEDSKDYFLAGRNVGWFLVGASIFASNIGSEHVVGLSGTGAKSGMPMAHFELHAWIVLLLGWVFLPFYARSGVFTMPEFLERRFSPAARWFLSIFSLLGYILTKVSVSVYAGGVVIETLTGLDFWTGALITVVLTGLYTVLGGMRAVVYTEALQAVILILGSLMVTILGLNEIGGWASLKASVGEAHFDMWRPASDPDFPWTGMVFGGAIIGIWYWCTDQYIVQRVLAARDLQQGVRGSIFGAFLKLLPVFIFLLPGIIAYGLAQNGSMELADADQALPALMSHLLPPGLRGLVAAGLLAALMSSLASVFNSCSTLFTIDIYKKLRPDSSEKELVRIGRVATSIVVVLGIAWIPVMQNISGVLYEYLQNVQSYIAPPITAVFLLGLFWKRINATGAIVTLIVGFFLGMSRLFAQIFMEHLDGFLYQWASINFLHLGILLFIICIAICIGVSLATAKPDLAKIQGLTYGTVTDQQREEQRQAYGAVEIAGSIIVLILITGVLLYFS
jgi:SSS family solute:Na+ symporter